MDISQQPICRPLFAGIFARAAYPEDSPFYITNAFVLDEYVSDQAVRSAWDKTMQVWPYFTRATVKRDRAYYLVENPLDFVIRETGEIVEPSTAEGNWHFVTICFEGQRLVFYIDHVPTDGTAIRMVLETFFYYYYCELDGVRYPVPEGVRTIEDGVAPDQETDAYLMVDAINPTALGNREREESFVYPECPQVKGRTELLLEDCGHYLVQVPSDEFMCYAKSVGGSPSSVLTQLVCQSMQRENPQNQLPLSVMIPISVRRAMGNPNSLLHQVVHTVYGVDPSQLEDDEAADFNKGFRTHLAQFASDQAVHYLCGMYRGIIEGYRTAIGADMLGQVTAAAGQAAQATTAAISYLGTLVTGDYGRRIHAEVFRAMPEQMAMAYMLEVGDSFYISFTIGAKAERYVRDMAEHMRELGMPHARFQVV